jgi:hypothetical protein
MYPDGKTSKGVVRLTFLITKGRKMIAHGNPFIVRVTD